MSGEAASGRIRLRGWARRGLELALPLPLLALAAAVFPLAPSAISPQASGRPDRQLLPPTPPASKPAARIGARVAVTAAAAARREPGLSRPRRVAHRQRLARVEP
jgi:hypothetical protein